MENEEPPSVDEVNPRPTRRSWFAVGAAALVTLAVAGYAAGVTQRNTEPGSQRTSATTISTGSSTTTASTTTTVPITTTTATTTTDTTVLEAGVGSTESASTDTPASPPPAPDVHAGGHQFPIRPATSASYASSHHDYPAADIFADCGADVVAPYSGVVQEVTTVDTWVYKVNDPATRGGLSFSIVGDDGVRYYGSHLAELDPATVVGARVSTGQRIGSVGETGNAAGTGCHLHFGISTPCGPGDVLRRRGEFWPQPHLDTWRRGESSSPVAEVATSQC